MDIKRRGRHAGNRGGRGGRGGFGGKPDMGRVNTGNGQHQRFLPSSSFSGNGQIQPLLQIPLSRPSSSGIGQPKPLLQIPSSSGRGNKRGCFSGNITTGGKERVFETKPTSLNKLKEFVTKEDRELVFTLQDEYFGFKLLLKQNKFSNEMIRLMLKALTIVASCTTCPVNSVALLNDALSSQFLNLHVPQYLTMALCDKQEETFLKAVIEDLLIIFAQLLTKFPNKASEALVIPFVMIRDVASRLEGKGEPLDAVLCQKLEDLDAVRSQNLSKFDSATREKMSQAECSQAKAPPSDFRQMSIYPTMTDVHEVLEPFLRENIVRGRYNNVEHYLDVHFRLLREDFIGPLRDGLTHYLTMVNLNKENQIKSKDVKIYYNVRVVVIEGSRNDGIVYRLNFDNSALNKVNWEASRRLMNGSLICISVDNFKSFRLGVITRREPKLLQDGYVTVRFVELLDTDMLDVNLVHKMVESPAYFEAYGPVLRGLQFFTEETFPFKQYVIEGETNIKNPRYLLDTSEYDFSVLMGVKDGTIPCRPLVEATWPTAEQLNLDPSQYSAFKTCLTKELAIVQGPPGTGKTFLGLKVVELLLANAEFWYDNRAPILVVCYTNHALDQFLEGILQFCPQGILRIGGQSRCESMEQHGINYKRRIVTDEHELPAYVYYNRKTLYWEMKEIRDEIQQQMGIIEKSERHILQVSVLQQYMLPHHHRMFTMHQFYEKKLAMLDWLGLSQMSWQDEEQQQQQPCYRRGNNDAYESDEDGVLVEEEIARRIEDDYFYDDSNDDIDDEDEQRDVYGRKRRKKMICNYQLVTHGINDLGGWQMTKADRKKLKKSINSNMKSTSIMTEDEVNRVVDIFKLNINQRWKLYRYWVSKLKEERVRFVQKLQEKYEQKFSQMKEVNSELDASIIRSAKVVGMTTTGAAKNRDLLQIIQPKIVIVEEAAEVLEAHVITSLSSACQHLIMIGDQQQLRPTPTVYKLARDYHFDVSLFERFIRNELPYERLELQHRMRPRIAELLVPHFYKNLRNHSSVETYPQVTGLASSVFFINHSQFENSTADTESKANEFEATLLIALCRHLLLQGYRPDQITILTFYKAQLFRIRQLAKTTIVKDVRSTVVDNYQGEENDIILLSLVRSNVEGRVGFLKVDNRVCVALSRAKIGLYCIGNFDFLAEHSNIWKPIVTSLKNDQLMDTKLILRCGNHPTWTVEVYSEQDFQNSPEGGCNRPCEYRLDCGHQCAKVCHSYDQEHEKEKCLKRCEKHCPSGHKCKKLCSDECGDCYELVMKEHPKCGHFNEIPCHVNPIRKGCRSRCELFLPCGHHCQNLCLALCTAVPCKEIVKKIAICGHEVSVRCSDQDSELVLLNSCKVTCSKLLTCEHRCRGDCASCHQGRMHSRCKEKCGRVLICGHQCNFPCAWSCPPCKEKCENYCVHSRCPMPCGRPCKPCLEPCAWQCVHLKCTKLCHEICDRPPCQEPCQLELNCGHPCIGFCGEPCPNLCRICDRDTVCEIFFGSEDEEEARFVLLEDCGHVVEASGMDQFISMETSAANADEHVVIAMKRCPRCSTIIRKTLRYNSVVGQTMKDVVSIKQRIFGDNKLVNKRLLQLTGSVKGFAESYTLSFPKVVNYFLVKIQQKLHINEINNMITVTGLFEKMAQQYVNLDLKCKMFHMVEFGIRNDERSPEFEPVKRKIQEVTSWILDLKWNCSEQQIYDLSREVQRMLMLSKLVESVHRVVLSDKAKDCFDEIYFCLYDLCPFTEFLEDEVNRKLAELQKLRTGLGISKVEKMEILSAIGFRQGHWYKCPNGHLYVITECGRAMQEGRCNECGAAIGGGSHRLRSDNQLASEMNG